MFYSYDIKLIVIIMPSTISLNIDLYDILTWSGIFFFYWIFHWLLIFKAFQSLSLDM